MVWKEKPESGKRRESWLSRPCRGRDIPRTRPRCVRLLHRERMNSGHYPILLPLQRVYQPVTANSPLILGKFASIHLFSPNFGNTAARFRRTLTPVVSFPPPPTGAGSCRLPVIPAYSATAVVSTAPQLSASRSMDSPAFAGEKRLGHLMELPCIPCNSVLAIIP